MSLSLALLSARKDLVRRLRDPLALVLWIGIPLVIGGLIGMAFGGEGGVKPRAHVLVVDQDESFLSQMLLGMLGSEQAGEVFRVEEVELEQGRARIENGEGSALLVIPAGFAEALLKEEPTTLELVTNPAQRILPGMVEEALSILVDGVFYVHRVLGDEVREIVDGPGGDENLFDDARVADISVRINERMRSMERFLFPAVLTLKVAEPEPELGEEEAQPMNIGALFFPTMLFMALLFVAQGLSDDVWREREQGTLHRVVTTPGRTGPFLLGKVIAGAAVVALVCGAGLLFGLALFDFELAPMGLALLWAVAAGSVLTLGMMLLQLLAVSQRAGSLITNTILFPLLMVGGSFFPFEAMPGWMASIGAFTPNGWALLEFKWILGGGWDPARIARDVAVAAVVGGVLFLLCARRLRGKFVQG